ncbi:transcriptional activator NhaR [Ideonella sp. TBM-1]|uniref:Transcriptional activator NhaR n=1 Tax=Ideonella livida TaxID=2707176 RepID=A0A7C9PIR2_9BURK|nr:transcriptional activator NhaR [Ideonella livida]
MNYKHLYYFWATAKAGGILRASQQLHVTPQTLSSQIKLLEDELGCALLRRVGRGLELTEAGLVAQDHADRIFSLGQSLQAALGQTQGAAAAITFRVGVADAVPKSIAYHLLEPALALDQAVRLLCREGKKTDLLGQLAVHQLDLVIADAAMDQRLSVKAFSHRLGSTAMACFAAPVLAQRLAGQPFPACLEGAPLLIQGMGSAMRQRLDLWLSEQALRPQVIGEFDDDALLKAFGAQGRGVFFSAAVLEQETCAQHGVRVLGHVEALQEELFAISVERQISHPCVAAITAQARQALMAAP